MNTSKPPHIPRLSPRHWYALSYDYRVGTCRPQHVDQDFRHRDSHHRLLCRPLRMYVRHWMQFLRRRQPKKVCSSLCSRLRPEVLKKEMRKRLPCNESLEKSVRLFIKILIKETINCQLYAATMFSEPMPIKKLEQVHVKPIGSATLPGSQAKEQPLVYPYPLHKNRELRHYLERSRSCPRDQKNRLFEELRAQKKDTV